MGGVLEVKRLGDKSLFAFRYGKGNKIPEDTCGQYDVYGANGVVSHIDEYNCEDISIIGHIGSVGVVKRCKGKCFVTYNGTIADIVDKSKVDSQYFYYLLIVSNLGKFVKGSQPFLSVSDFSNVEIPIPSLKVQQEIVDILDVMGPNSASLQDALRQEIEQRRKQYEYYRDKLLSFKRKVD